MDDDQDPGAPVDAFFVAATASLQERRPRTLKHGDTFGVFDHSGNVLAGQGEPGGLYFRDTRHLSRLDLFLDGQRPLLLSSDVRQDNATLTTDLTNPDLYDDGRMTLEHDQVHIRRSTFLYDAACHQRLAVRSYADAPQTVTLELRFAADFADLFEVRGQRRPRRGSVQPPAIEAAGVRLAYTGLDGRQRTTRLRFDPAPTRIEPTHASFVLPLAPGERVVIYVEARCTEPVAPLPSLPETFFLAMRDARRALLRGASRAAAIETAERHVQRDRAPLGRRSLHADHRHRAGRLPLRRRALVQRRVRARRAADRADDAVDRPRRRPRRAALPRGEPVHLDRARCRCRARKNPARGAPRRDGGAEGGAVPPLLRQRRCHAAVRHARGKLPPPHRRCRDGAGAVAADRGGADLDRRARRPRSRRLRRIPPHDGERARQPGLEGQPRFRSSMPTAGSPRGRSR